MHIYLEVNPTYPIFLDFDPESEGTYVAGREMRRAKCLNVLNLAVQTLPFQPLSTNRQWPSAMCTVCAWLVRTRHQNRRTKICISLVANSASWTSMTPRHLSSDLNRDQLCFVIQLTPCSVHPSLLILQYHTKAQGSKINGTIITASSITWSQRYDW